MERALQRYAELRRSCLEHRRYRSFFGRRPRDSPEQQQQQEQPEPQPQRPYALTQAHIDQIALVVHEFLLSNNADLYLMASMIFLTVFWCFHVLGMGFFVTASSAVAMATLGYKYVEADGEDQQPADSTVPSTLQLRRRAKAYLKTLADDVRTFSADLASTFSDESFVHLCVCFGVGIPASVWLMNFFDEKISCAIALSTLGVGLYYSSWRRQLDDYLASRDHSEDELLSSVEMMPSHEDCNTSSTDFELSELDADSSEVDGIHFKNIHFKQLSSSSSSSSSDSLVADELDVSVSVSDDDTLASTEQTTSTCVLTFSIYLTAGRCVRRCTHVPLRLEQLLLPRMLKSECLQDRRKRRRRSRKRRSGTRTSWPLHSLFGATTTGNRLRARKCRARDKSVSRTFTCA
ncbi:unnamed protein product [Trichogramma brassicae]|uniref:Reticulon domain-containing protein n=1 Tax=Trichogramma brassicae TaxID=86971 RepID=A0A6H5I8P8_9HYME|nr:unnamed protein product [Trichogramma brassicae]